MAQRDLTQFPPGLQAPVVLLGIRYSLLRPGEQGRVALDWIVRSRIGADHKEDLDVRISCISLAVPLQPKHELFRLYAEIRTDICESTVCKEDTLMRVSTFTFLCLQWEHIFTRLPMMAKPAGLLTASSGVGAPEVFDSTTQLTRLADLSSSLSWEMCRGRSDVRNIKS